MGKRVSEEEGNGERGKRGGKGLGGWGEGKSERGGRDLLQAFHLIFILLDFYFISILFFNFWERRDLLLALPLNYCIKAKVPTCIKKKIKILVVCLCVYTRAHAGNTRVVQTWIHHTCVHTYTRAHTEEHR